MAETLRFNEQLVCPGAFGAIPDPFPQEIKTDSFLALDHSMLTLMSKSRQAPYLIYGAEIPNILRTAKETLNVVSVGTAEVNREAVDAVEAYRPFWRLWGPDQLKIKFKTGQAAVVTAQAAEAKKLLLG